MKKKMFLLTTHNSNWNVWTLLVFHLYIGHMHERNIARQNRIFMLIISKPCVVMWVIDETQRKYMLSNVDRVHLTRTHSRVKPILSVWISNKNKTECFIVQRTGWGNCVNITIVRCIYLNHVYTQTCVLHCNCVHEYVHIVPSTQWI